MGTERLGFASKKYESGKRGVHSISSGKGDPGGKSYGEHQLASKTGTLAAYLKQSAYSHEFKGLLVGSPEFDAKWKYLATHDGEAFAADQHDFIKRTHYDPVRTLATKLKIPSTTAINETLFSMSVQHWGTKRIILNASIKSLDDESTIVTKLFEARRAYVKQVLSKALADTLLVRYKAEEKDMLNLVGK